MPAGAVKGPEGEAQWKRAKATVKAQYGDIEKSDPEKFYALTMTVYKSMCSKHKCGPKAESMGNLLRRLEESSGSPPRLKLPRDEDGWGLHSVGGREQPESKFTAAVVRLNQATEEAADVLWSALDKYPEYDEVDVEDALFGVLGGIIEPAMDKYQSVGAGGRDARKVALELMVGVVSAKYGKRIGIKPFERWI